MTEYGDNLRIIAMPGTEDFAGKIDFYLKEWRNTTRSFILPVKVPRFLSGDAKAELMESARGKDLFIISDPDNCSIRYGIRGYENHMSPDDHFQDIKRVITAVNDKAGQISVMMNILYAAKQDSRHTRESLDCALALQELERVHVKNIITFDAHNPKIQNAIPLVSFDNLYPHYQMVKALVRKVPGIKDEIKRGNVMMVSPDEGGVQRCLKCAEAMKLDICMFYKQRDVQHTTDGNNAILRHEFLGGDITGKDVIIVDDMIIRGDSLVECFGELKARGARRIFAFITFGLFVKGYAEYDKAYEQGLFDTVFITNLTYHKVENDTERPYIDVVDMSKYAAYIIDCIDRNMSISNVLVPATKIRELLDIE
jgi:ribose-phosphate pyrophosphokinase